jgi:chitodextrinase
MTGRRRRILTLALFFTGALGLSAASAAPDLKPPTTPKNFRVTAKTLGSVSLAWNPSTDNSGNFTYTIAANALGPRTLPKTATSFTWTSDIYPGIFPGRSYLFYLSAVDAAGNRSSWATVSVNIPPDTTPPTAGPSVSAPEVGSNYVDLAWTAAQDDGPIRFYEVWVNGSRYGTTANRSLTVRFLQPQTAYSFQVRAQDYGNNFSPFSNALAVTTPPPNPDDTTPPTTPANLGVWSIDGATEFEISWSESTDDFDDPEDIRYDVYVNGVWADVYFGGGRRNIIYLTFGELNLIEVFASDTAGNESEPATITVDLR